MKKISIIFILSLSTTILFGQVGGVSNAKLAALNSEAIPRNTVEFEPTVFHISAKKAWDKGGDLQDLYSTSDSVLKNTGLSFRFTYGLWDVLEIGGSISTDLANTSLGMKYNFWSNQKMGIAAVAGANIPLGNKTIDKTVRLADNLTSIGGGLIYSINFNEEFSFDASAQYLFFATETDDNNKGTVYINGDLGYFILDHKIQLVIGAGYQSSSFDQLNSNSVTVYPGFTLHTGNRYVIILQAPFDIAGKNALKNAGVAFSLTIAID